MWSHECQAFISKYQLVYVTYLWLEALIKMLWKISTWHVDNSNDLRISILIVYVGYTVHLYLLNTLSTTIRKRSTKRARKKCIVILSLVNNRSNTKLKWSLCSVNVYESIVWIYCMFVYVYCMYVLAFH